MHEHEKVQITHALVDIFNMGDRDEMSWKHLGHGMAAMLAFEDWRQAVDYQNPGGPFMDHVVEAWWNNIAQWIDTIGVQETLDWLPELARTRSEFLYLNNYVTDTWLPYHDAIVAKGLKIRKG